MPRAAHVVGEEAPAVLAVLIGKEDSDSILLRQGRAAIVVSPYYTEEERTGRSHHGNIWQDPTAVIARKRINDFEEERMVRDGAHYVV
jgi:hypothetical protein